MVKKSVGNIRGHNMIETGWKHSKRSGFTGNYILPEESYNNRRKSIENITVMRYNEFHKFIMNNKDTLFEAGHRYSVSILTEGGWRTSKQGTFNGGETPIIYNAYTEYGNERDHVDYVFMIHIVRYD